MVSEFLLVDAESKPVLAVRAVTENVFQKQDWEEFSVTGPCKSPLSGLLSGLVDPLSDAFDPYARPIQPQVEGVVDVVRWVGGTRRLKIKYFVLTSYTRWAFGIFNDDGSFANIS
jgi:hypothetical protein